MRKFILALVTIVALLAYLGLAILGWGGFAAFFSHSALIALTIVLFAPSGVAIFSDGNLSPGVREDRANRWVIVAFCATRRLCCSSMRA
jgi:multisubunit Na+/H+ antiporter MnhG subunit